MRILLIEDDSNKMLRIATELRDIRNDIELSEARSYRSGVRELMSSQFDLLLLDMSLPVFDISREEDGFQVDAFAGRNILFEMTRKNVAVSTIVITMFETFGDGADLMTLAELDKDLRTKYPDIYKGVIYYNSSEINWRESLRAFLGESR